MLAKLAAIAAGGAAGALLRYGLAGWVQGRSGASFPWGTLAVNLLGCFVIGLAATFVDALRAADSAAAEPVRNLLLIGLLGAFTTFSTFSFESLALLRGGKWALAAANLIGSGAAGVALALLGVWLGQWLTRAT